MMRQEAQERRRARIAAQDQRERDCPGHDWREGVYAVECARCGAECGHEELELVSPLAREVRCARCGMVDYLM